jgi:hypothetical protein
MHLKLNFKFLVKKGKQNKSTFYLKYLPERAETDVFILNVILQKNEM